MDTYFELKAIPDPELLQSAVVGKLMQAMHGLLPSYQGRLGISFPGYGQARTLGGILRLHGSSDDMQELHSQLRKTPVVGSYSLITDLNRVPENISEHGIFKRMHTKSKSDINRLIQRHKNRGTWTQVLEAAIRDSYSQDVICPHVRLKSYSTGQPSFLLFVRKMVCKYPTENGKFNTYGLSKNGATVPLF